MADPRPPQGETLPPRAGWLGRLMGGAAPLRSALGWARRNRRLAIGGAAGVLAASIGTFFLLSLVIPTAETSHASLEESLAVLRAGTADAARELAAELRTSKQISYADRGAVLFILGSAVACDAEAHASDGSAVMRISSARRRMLATIGTTS